MLFRLSEYITFTKKQPLTGVVIGLSFVYGINMVRKSFTKAEGEFWNIDGIGASTSTTSSTSSSHSMMDRKTSGDLMTHPTALYGINGGMSTTTSTSSAHGHKRTSNYGEDVYKSPLTLMGVPSHLKRRVGNATETESYQTNNPVVAEVETVESALGWL